MHFQSNYGESSMEKETEVGEDENDLYEDLDLTVFDKDNINVSLESSDAFLSKENLETIFANIDDVAHPAMKIWENEELLDTMPPTSKQAAEMATPMKKFLI